MQQPLSSFVVFPAAPTARWSEGKVREGMKEPSSSTVGMGAVPATRSVLSSYLQQEKAAALARQQQKQLSGDRGYTTGREAFLRIRPASGLLDTH